MLPLVDNAIVVSNTINMIGGNDANGISGLGSSSVFLKNDFIGKGACAVTITGLAGGTACRNVVTNNNLSSFKAVKADVLLKGIDNIVFQKDGLVINESQTDTLSTKKPSTTDDSSQIQAGETSWHTAMECMGKQATVCGKIIDFGWGAPGITVLGMGKGYMEPGAVGIEVRDSDKAKFPEDLYVGKTISVTGKVKMNPVGGASIELTDLSQIVVK